MSRLIDEKIKNNPHLATVPLLLPAISLIMGLMAASLLSDLRVLLAAFSLSVLVSWLLRRWPSWQSLGILSCFFWLGMLVGQRTTKVPIGDGLVEAVVMSEPTEKPKTIAVDLLLPDHHQQVRCYLWKDERSQQLALGQSLMVRHADQGFVRSNDWQLGGKGF